jgi:hypothetical protein
MPRVTVVKHAQQRYETVPVLDDRGQPKVVPVMRNGVQRTTKRGRPVTMRLTREDRTKPKPNLRCDFPACDKGGEIKPDEAPV